MAKAEFRCQVCSSMAAVLELAVPADAPAGELRLEGFLWECSTEMVKGQTVRALHHALTMHDAQQIHTLNPMWAPFYCPQCQRVYCVKHWHITPHFDDDFAGWYDSSHGVCPRGHRRLVDD
ncbi:MAG TPA: hypothetical protein VFF59_03315 [Anaerolineae bacterium]|nr:hypothetical protein [Anaerolineae bacterium]